MNSTTRTILIGLLILFVLLRIPGLSIPYQQDEFKTAVAAEAGLSQASAFLAHPPLTALLYRADAVVFGGANLRAMPLLFGLLSVVLLFVVVRRRFNDHAALWAVFLYTVSFYSIWASLMLDTDGVILPTMFLAALYCYDRARSENSKRWIVLLVLALITGLLVKLSFIIIIGVFMVDFLFEKRKELTSGRLVRFAVMGGGLIVLVGAAFALVKLIDPAFSVSSMVSHALFYVHISGRSYLQVVIESVKAVFYLSPLLLVPLIGISKDIVRKTTPFLWYLALGFLFYFVLFDFSHGALDKYLMFTIIPFSVISGAILSQLFTAFPLDKKSYGRLGLGIAVSAALVALMFVPPEVVALYPKTLWFSRVVHGSWNVLTPFNGGSGPVGFYVSFLVIACGFLVAGVAALAGRLRPSLLALAGVVIVSSGIAYNAAFMEEFSFGKVYGSAKEALQPALAYIASSTEITSVLTYNDIGAYDLRHIGKYTARFYAAPQFEASQRAGFPTFKGVFLVVNVPPLYNGFYSDFFKSCKVLFTAQSGLITSTVYSACTWTKE